MLQLLFITITIIIIIITNCQVKISLGIFLFLAEIEMFFLKCSSQSNLQVCSMVSICIDMTRKRLLVKIYYFG